MYVDQPLSWLDALNQCQVNKGHLVTIESIQEINYLAGKSLSTSKDILCFKVASSHTQNVENEHKKEGLGKQSAGFILFLLTLWIKENSSRLVLVRKLQSNK